MRERRESSASTIEEEFLAYAWEIGLLGSDPSEEDELRILAQVEELG
ncbi:hypothetical protein [Singulisphaera acidiphila]|nr:hypothetical protein [Singulisphaera acidiphila]